MNSRKSRLEFIRTKNKLRSGEKHCYMKGKVINEILHDSEKMGIKIDNFIISGWKVLKKTWKLKTDYVKTDFKIGTDGDDFIKNVSTVQIKFYLK